MKSSIKKDRSNSCLNSKNMIFKPLIASSLALVLNASAVSMQDTGFYDGGQKIDVPYTRLDKLTDGYDHFQKNGMPNNYPESVKVFFNSHKKEWDLSKNQIELDKSYILYSQNGLAMGNGGGTLTIDMWTASGDNNARNFTLDLSNITTDNHYAIYGNLAVTGSDSGSVQNYSNKVFTGKFGGQGISGSVSISALGKTDLVFSSGATIGGNLSISGGINTIDFGNRNYGASNARKTITLNGGTTTISNLNTLYADIIRNNNTSTGTVTFNGLTHMIGNITRNGELGSPNVGDIVINFNSGSTLTGNIQTTHSNDFSSNQVTFQGATSAESVVLSGNIISHGTGFGNGGLDTNNGNHVILRQGSMQGNITVSRDGYRRLGYNEIILEQNGAFIRGNVQASGGAPNNTSATNKIIFKEQGILEGNITTVHSTIANDGLGGFNSITFENGGRIGTINNTIIASGGCNNILFQGNNDATINANIRASTTAYSGQYKNTITLSGGSTNTINGNITGDLYGTNSITFGVISNNGEITSNNGINTINGNITANQGINNIHFSGISNAVVGDINATGGSNNIAFFQNSSLGNTSSTIVANGGNNYVTVIGDLNLNSSIYSGGTSIDGNGGDSGASGINRFFLSGNVELGNNFLIRSSNRNNQNTEKRNIIKFDSTLTNNATIEEVTAVTGNNHLDYTTNILSFDGLNADTQLTIGHINNANVVGNSYATGYNYIGKDLTTGDNANALTLSSVFANSWASNNYQATHLNLTIAHNIYAKYGKNYINVGSLSVDKEIDGNAGTNNIATTTFSANLIKSRWGGANNIIVNGNATINGNIIAGDNNSAGTNIISITGDAKIGEDIATTILTTTQKNVISLGNGTSNTLNLMSLTSDSGQNYIAKNIVVGTDTGVLTLDRTLTDNSYFDDNRAFTGQLSISKGVSGNNKISFKASTSQTTTVIDGHTETNNAISTAGGNNNIYLNVADATSISSGVAAIQQYLNDIQSANGDDIQIAQAYSSLAESSIIAGDITNSGGTTNLKIIGTANTTTGIDGQAQAKDNAQIGILGNINNSGGSVNIVLKDTIFAPSQMIINGNQSPVDVGGSKAGNITTSGGITTLVTRFSNASPTPTGASMYNINNSNGGTTNVIIQGDIDLGSNIKYDASGKVNLIFTNQFEERNVNFSELNIQDQVVSVFGTTYQDGIRLTLQDKNVKSGDGEQSFLKLAGVSESDHSFSFTTSRKENSNGGSTDIITIRGVAVGEIVSLAESVGASYDYDITLDTGAIYLGSVALSKSTQTIGLTMNQGSKLFTDNDIFLVNNLTINGIELDRENLLQNSFMQRSTVIDLATDGNDFGSITSRSDFRLLAIGDVSNANAEGSTKTIAGLRGNNALFRVYVNPNRTGILGGRPAIDTNTYSDRILVTTGSGGNHYIQAIYDANTNISNITYHGGGTEKEGNIAVATVKTSTGITFEGAKQIQGFDLVGTTLKGVNTGIDGSTLTGTDYTTYFIKSATSTGASPVNADTTRTALGVNYDLFLANFNSLNKRMGELRNNDHAQGTWGRIFNGMLKTSYGLETKSIYTTVQAGYDYAFGFEGANNYLGVALSYTNSLTDSNKMLDYDGIQKGIDNSTTHGVEVALYNSYVQDSGWFNDTILKFSYMMSDLSIAGQNTNYNTNNFGIVFSDEFGYRFKLGSEQEWFIDPQVELGLGYFNQSDLKQVLGAASLYSVQSAITTLRARAGVNWAYDFKKFTQGKGINASVYVGTYYSYDEINGGDISLTTNLGKTTHLTSLDSTGRFELNLGTNLEIQNNTRIYFDFEKSFGGSITTEYQVNVGVRYSFGENAGYTPIDPNKQSMTPLKVSNENIEESKEDVENTSSETKSKVTDKQNKSSIETQNQEKAQ